MRGVLACRAGGGYGHLSTMEASSESSLYKGCIGTGEQLLCVLDGQSAGSAEGLENGSGLGGIMSDGICEKRSEFGVLFVGGFGVQGSGTAIASLGGALYRWLFHWSCQADLWDESSPKLEDTVLSASGGADSEPAHLILDLPLRPGADEPGEQSRGRWLLAESSWADLFAPPRFLGMARWIWKVSTCLLVLQFVIPMRRHWGQARLAQGPWYGRLADCVMAACYLALMGVAAMLSVLLSGVLLALAVAANLPIPRIDQAVHWVVVRVSAVLGDSYMLAHCPVQLAAMRTKVAGDLRWLQDRCEKVAVVAHSQGAAIAHRVLKDDSSYRAGDVRAFITLGQGISKLHMLQHLDWDPRVRPAARRSRLLVSIGMACAGLPALGLIVSRWASPGVVTFLINVRHSIPLILAGFAVIWLGVSQAMRAMRVIEGDLKRELGFKREPGSDTGAFSWSDYYASADPVSNGPLSPGSGSVPGRDPDAGGEALLLPSPCNQVSNSGSVLFDHNGYLRNQNQLVSMLLNDLVAAAHSKDGDTQPPPPLVSATDVKTAGQRRRWLVAWLLAWRFLAVGIGVALWQVNPAPLLMHPMNWLVHLFAPHAGMSNSLARLAAVALITAAAYILVAVIPWRIMEEHEVHRFFDTAHRRADTSRRDTSSPRPRPDWRILVRWPWTSANHRA